MRLLFVINGLNRGGAEIMLSRLVESEALRECEIAVVSLLGPGDLSAAFEGRVAVLRHLDLKNPLKIVGGVFGLVRLIVSFRPQIIHSWLYQADLLAGICSICLGKRQVVWSIRQTNLSLEHNSLATKTVILICALLSRFIPAKIVSNANAAVKTHVAQGYDASKIITIPNGVDTVANAPDASQRKAIRDELNIPATSPVVGMVARFDSQKNHRGFFEAAKSIRKKLPNVVFLLCGDGITPRNDDIMAMVSGAGLQDCTHLLGKRTDTTAVLNAIDLLLSPSHGEGWPNVVGEAMACGTPCVATDVGDTATIIGKVGCVVEAGDMQMIAQRALEILTLPEQELARLTVSARERIVEKFEMEAIAARYRETYEWISPVMPGSR